jgi:hypothetical protein
LYGLVSPLIPTAAMCWVAGGGAVALVNAADLVLLHSGSILSIVVSRALWVPTISSTSRDQAIFVDRATDASLPPYAVLPENDRLR